MPVSEATYRRVALEDPDGEWELVCGQLRRKPAMTTEHNMAARILNISIARQIDLQDYVVSELTRLRRPSGDHFIPDVCVIPMELVRRLRERPGTFEAYGEPMPLVAEVWSPSTGRYDVTQKLEDHKLRGDQEIWLIHPYQRTLTAWVRQPDGSYVETVHRDGIVRPAFLQGVAIDLDTLFA